MKYTVYPAMGSVSNKAFIAAVIGGLGSLPGAVIGGVLLGLLENACILVCFHYVPRSVLI